MLLFAGLALAAAFGQEPAAPSAGGQSRILEHARMVALDYTRSLPDFLCSQVSEFPEPWRSTDW